MCRADLVVSTELRGRDRTRRARSIVLFVFGKAQARGFLSFARPITRVAMLCVSPTKKTMAIDGKNPYTPGLHAQPAETGLEWSGRPPRSPHLGHVLHLRRVAEHVVVPGIAVVHDILLAVLLRPRVPHGDDGWRAGETGDRLRRDGAGREAHSTKNNRHGVT